MLTLKSAESKVALMEGYLKYGSSDQANPNQLMMDEVRRKLGALKDFTEELDYGLLSQEDLKKQYETHDLHDRSVTLLLRIQPQNEAETRRLHELQRKAVTDMIDDLVRYCGADEEKFGAEFRR